MPDRPIATIYKPLGVGIEGAGHWISRVCGGAMGVANVA